MLIFIFVSNKNSNIEFNFKTLKRGYYELKPCFGIIKGFFLSIESKKHTKISWDGPFKIAQSYKIDEIFVFCLIYSLVHCAAILSLFRK